MVSVAATVLSAKIAQNTELAQRLVLVSIAGDHVGERIFGASD